MNLEETGVENVVDYNKASTYTVIENKNDGHQCEITLAAYFIAERRGFEPGYALDDWLEAEHDIMGSPNKD